MKKSLLPLVILSSALIIFAYQPVLTGQPTESFDEEQLSAIKTVEPKALNTSEPKSRLRPNNEVKYVAGKDKLWFTADDEVYHYYHAEYDDKGKMIKKSCYKIGPDNTLFTGDDELQDYFIYEYDAQGGPLKEIYYKRVNGKDVEDFYSIDEHDSAGCKTKSVRYDINGNILHYTVYDCGTHHRSKRDIEYKGKGADNIWFTKDDQIEKYHVREFDEDQRLRKAREYHVDYRGSGADGVWFTADDVVSSTREFNYGKGRPPIRTIKSIGPGPDKEWFTGDGQLQYYTVRYYIRVMDGK